MGCLVYIFLAVVFVALAHSMSVDILFGDRCRDVYPNDALKQERCVYDLQHGKRL